MSNFHLMFDFEDGTLSEDATRVWFSDLVDSGDIWKMPTPYVVLAADLLEKGLIGNSLRRVQ